MSILHALDFLRSELITPIPYIIFELSHDGPNDGPNVAASTRYNMRILATSPAPRQQRIFVTARSNILGKD